MRRILLVALLAFAVGAAAQITGDQLGSHDLTPMGGGDVHGRVANACLYCHAPHGGMTAPTPLWNQQLSVRTYTMYGSTTYHQTGVQPPVGSPSKLCLSCHDGTVAPGQTVAFGQLTTTGTMKAGTVLGTDLSSSHPFSLQTPLVDVADINALLFAAPPRTADPAVKLVNNTIECTTCHNVHFQGLDQVVKKFLARESSNGALCLACHDPNRVVGGQTNRLAGWAGSVHSTATNGTSNNPYVGGYATVAQNACQSCHTEHNAAGPARLLRGADQAACANCHSGGNTQPVILNVFAELGKVGHPVPTANNQHDANEAALLNNNRHATCADCHNAHAAQPTASFSVPPLLRPSQVSIAGIGAVDGRTPVQPYAVNQYENCFRCHATSIGKTTDSKYGYLPLRVVGFGDPLNVAAQMAANNLSSHPVTHDRSSPLAQPSLLPNMLKLDGATPGRAMGTRIFCTDCHNSDDNRESGGSGPNGPHGSQWTHILERRYEMTQAAVPGGPATNLFPSPDLTVSGPFALCAKCHNLNIVVAPTNPFDHSRHVDKDGFSCSACHSAHGSNNSTPGISGQRLVNFDVSVVAPFNGTLAYNQPARSCTLQCHNHKHNNASY